jgi:hypothetical protein
MDALVILVRLCGGVRTPRFGGILHTFVTWFVTSDPNIALILRANINT